MGYPMPKPNLWKKLTKIVIFVLILALIIFYFIATRYGFQTKVQKTIPALELSVATKENPTKTKITIDGTYTHYIFPNYGRGFLAFSRKDHLDSFDGSISISSHKETQGKNYSLPLTFLEGSATLSYIEKGKDNYLDLGETFGSIHATKNLEQMIILIMEKKGSQSSWDVDHSFLVAPATTKEDVIEVFNQYLKEYPDSSYAPLIIYLKSYLLERLERPWTNE